MGTVQAQCLPAARTAMACSACSGIGVFQGVEHVTSSQARFIPLRGRVEAHRSARHGVLHSIHAKVSVAACLVLPTPMDRSQT